MSGAELPGISSPLRGEATTPTEALEALKDVAGQSADENPARLGRDARDKRHALQAGLPPGVIHELRTPLTSIHGYAQVLQRTLRNEPRATNAVNVLVRESNRLSAMLAELSELSELESGEITTTPIDVEVHQIVDGVIHEVARRDANAHPISIDGTAIARCNPTLLSQALLHVLTNATRYSEPGSPISVSIATHGSTVEIVVADEGISILPSDDLCIYEPFERGANARQSGTRGLGLGLFLARRALQLNDGKITHKRRNGGGTTFHVLLPQG
jgi:signal transduction histidine kinase